MITNTSPRSFSLVLVFSIGCAAGCMEVADGERSATDDSTASHAESTARRGGKAMAPILAPIYFEPNEAGEVPGGPVPDQIDDEVPKAVGSQPIHVQKYGPFGNGGTLSTGFPTSDWIATVVGIDTTDGDINENGTGNPLRAFPFQSGGIWHVTFDFRSHYDNESWSIWVMYIRRDMATSTNF